MSSRRICCVCASDEWAHWLIDECETQSGVQLAPNEKVALNSTPGIT